MSKGHPAGGYKRRFLVSFLALDCIVLFLFVFFGGISFASSSSSSFSVSITSVLSLAIIDNASVQNNVNVDIIPNSSGSFNFASTNIITNTTNENGLTLTMSNNDEDTDLHHIDSAIITTIPTLPSSSNETTFPANHYGYNFNNTIDTTNPGFTGLLYLPVPALSAPITLATTDSQGSNTYPFTIGAKVDLSIPAGIYQDTVVISATANYVPSQVYEFSYTEAEQTFVAPANGTYKIEVWGAQGGSLSGKIGGYGGYANGDIALKKNDTLYLYVGGQPAGLAGGYNGGGTGYHTTAYSRGGGGSTDVRIVNGVWSDISSLSSRIMVAGAGGGGYCGFSCTSSWTSVDGASGGGLQGLTGIANGTCLPQGGTQTSGGVCNGYAQTAGSFGKGGNGYGHEGYRWASGGGSGYYGGSARYDASNTSSSPAGGSSFISGHNGCVAIESDTSLAPRLSSTGARCADGTTDIVCSYHYSGKIFTNTVMIDGAGYSWTTVKGTQQQMPNPAGGYYPLGQGHTGNGHVRITGPL